MPVSIEPGSTGGETYAALDLGSNSFHLLIAGFDGHQLRTIDRHKDSVRFGAGLDDNNCLSRAVLETAMASLARMAERLRPIPRDHIRVVGTNTLRAAANGPDFLERAESVLGVPVHIISGTEEARLIYQGVASDMALPPRQRRLIIDIGGGSTEMVIGRQQAEVMESEQLGCVSYSRAFFPGGAISRQGFKAALKSARRDLSPYITALRGNWQQAVGTSGTIRSIGRMLTQLGITDHDQVTAAGLRELSDRLLTVSNINKLSIPGLGTERKPVFPGGLVILRALFEELDIAEMQVSDYALREGIILDLVGRLHHRDRRSETVDHLMRQYGCDTGQARRVAGLAERWLPGIADHIGTPRAEAEDLLYWAACLHELGLAVAHGGYHKHGAYILANADMPGFSRQEQARLSFLVLNHRRKPKAPSGAYGVKPDWLLVSLFRLACIFHRRRQSEPVPETIRLTAGDKKSLRLTLPAGWLDDNPLTAADLEDERSLMGHQGVLLTLVPR